MVDIEADKVMIELMEKKVTALAEQYRVLMTLGQEVEEKIGDLTLRLGKTQTQDGVKISYYKESIRQFYSDPLAKKDDERITPELIEKHTTMVKNVDWTSIMKEAGIEKQLVSEETVPAHVLVKLL